MTIAASVVVSKVQLVLQDATAVRWTSNELLGWINSGVREIVLLKPNASVVNTTAQLTAGTKQTIPAIGLMLIDVVRNMGTTGKMPGRAITGISRTVLDATLPDWHGSQPSEEVKHFCADPRDPKTYYVYPPQPTTGNNYVELVVSSTPPAITSATTGTIELDDIYESPLVDYVLYRAYSKDADFASNRERAQGHYQAFVGALTGKTQAEGNFAPRVQFTPNGKGA